MRFRYWTIRYVPDSMRMDSVTMGIIVSSEEIVDIQVRTLNNYTEIPDIGGPRKEALRWVKKFISNLDEKFSWESELELDLSSTPSTYLEKNRIQFQNLVQLDRPRFAAGTNASEVANMLFMRLVAREHRRGRQQYVTRVRSEVQNTYAAHSAIHRFMRKNPEVEVSHRDTPIDLAIVDSKIFELNTAFSFQSEPDSNLEHKIDAWTFRIEKLRDQGGTLSLKKTGILDIPQNTPVVAVVDPPNTIKQRRLYNAVTRDWKDLGITQISPSALPAHAAKLDQRIEAA